jgi:transcriptional regulator with XRE-family HTH domain
MHQLREFLIRRRFSLGLSQRELARQCRINAGTIASIESGRVQRFPSLATLEALARGLQVEMSLLVDLAREGAPESPSVPGVHVHVDSDRGVAHHALLAEERKLLLECAEAGLSDEFLAFFRLHESPPEDRRVTLLILQALAVEHLRRMRQLRGVLAPDLCGS